MCDTKFSTYLCSVRLESVHVQEVMYPLGFPWWMYLSMCLVWVFFSRCVTSAVSFCFFIHVSVVFLCFSVENLVI